MCAKPGLPALPTSGLVARDNFRVASQNPKPTTPGREHYHLMTPTVEIQRHAVVDPRRADVREQISNSVAQTDLHRSLA